MHRKDEARSTGVAMDSTERGEQVRKSVELCGRVTLPEVSCARRSWLPTSNGVIQSVDIGVLRGGLGAEKQADARKNCMYNSSSRLLSTCCAVGAAAKKGEAWRENDECAATPRRVGDVVRACSRFSRPGEVFMQFEQSVEVFYGDGNPFSRTHIQQDPRARAYDFLAAPCHTTERALVYR